MRAKYISHLSLKQEKMVWCAFLKIIFLISTKTKVTKVSKETKNVLEILKLSSNIYILMIVLQSIHILS